MFVEYQIKPSFLRTYSSGDNNLDTSKKDVGEIGEKTVQNFTPTRKMRAWLQAYLESDSHETITSLCTRAGVSRRTYYDWINQHPDFLQWLNQNWMKFMCTIGIKKLDQIGLERSQDSFDYFKTMMDRLRMLQEPLRESTTNVTIGDIYYQMRRDRGLPI